MRGFRDTLEADILLQEKLLKEDTARLKKIPHGKLKVGKNGESFYLCRRDGKIIYLSRHSKIVKGLRERRFLEKRMEVMTQNLKGQRRLLQTYQPYTDEDINLLLPRTYRFNSGEEGRMVGEGLTPVVEGHGAGYEEDLRFAMKDGQRRRSKSEVIISMMLDAYQIPYKYEPKIFWPDGMPPEAEKFKAENGIPNMVAPDFGFQMPDGRWKYWEHLGLLGEWDYLMRWAKKMGFYHWVGITPGDNLIITADDKGGSISQEAIAEIIECNLKPLHGLGKRQ